MDASKPRYLDVNGTIYYRTRSIYYEQKTNRLISDDINIKNLESKIHFESYSSNSNDHLCFVLSNFTKKNTIEKSYVLFNNDDLINIIKSKDTLHIYDKCDANSKIFYINFNNYLLQLANGSSYKFNVIARYSPLFLIEKEIKTDDHILIVSKKIDILKKYIMDFSNIHKVIEKDLKEFSKLIIDTDTMNKNKLNNLLTNFFSLSPYEISNHKLRMVFSRFINMQIIYNNYDDQRISKITNTDEFTKLINYNSIIRDLNLKENKIIQLKGLKFILSNSIYVSTGFVEHLVFHTPEIIIKYILSVCDIDEVVSEIEKLILSN